MVLLPCSKCCDVCEPCKHSPNDCLMLTLSGFAGSGSTSGCDECNHLNGDYILRRADRPAELTSSIVPVTPFKGSGATVSSVLSIDPETEEYTISSVTLTAGGSGYTGGAKYQYYLKYADTPCNKGADVEVTVGRVPPQVTASVSTGDGGTLGVSLEPASKTSGSESWGVGSVSVASAGTKYIDGEEVSFAINKIATVVSQPQAKIAVIREEPTLAAWGHPSWRYDVTLASSGSPPHWGAGSVSASVSYPGYEWSSKDGYFLDVPVWFTYENPAVVLEAGEATHSVTGRVKSVAVVNGGSGYSSPPAVSFSGGQGSGASAVATIRGGVGSLSLTNGGSGYTEDPTVTFSGGGGSGAMADAYVVDGAVTKLSVTSPGLGYESAPSVTISGGGGSGAAATASISGEVLSVQVTGEGTGYTEPPTVSLSGDGIDAHAEATIDGADSVVTISNPGRYYGNGGIESVTVTASGEFYVSDAVQTVKLIDGGSFFPTPFCEYSWRGCAACCDNGAMGITFTAGADKHELSVYHGPPWASNTICDAVAPSDGDDWTDFTFGADSFYPGVQSIAVLTGGNGYSSPPSVTIIGSGTGAEAVAKTVGYVDSISLKSGGSGYTSTPTVTISGGGGSGATATVWPVDGVLTSITLGSGGSGYTSPPTVTISGGGGSGASAVATVRQAVDSISVTKAGAGYKTAPSVTISGGGGSGATAQASLTRTPAGCFSSGTATLSAVECTAEPELPPPAHDLPSQVSMTLSGLVPIFTWWMLNGGVVGMAPCKDGGGSGWGRVFCDECDGFPQEGIVVHEVGTSFGIGGYGVRLALDNFVAVLDKVDTECGSILYRGYVPALPSAFYRQNYDSLIVLCREGELTEVSMSLSCVSLSTSVLISSPTATHGGSTATAEVAGVVDGKVSGLLLTGEGSGYAKAVVERSEPSIAVGVETASGVNAALSVSLQQYNGGEETVWYVDSVAVDNGGSGYAQGELLSFSTADEAADIAGGHVITGVAEPTISAAASGGSSAELSVSLSSAYSGYGFPGWQVDGVTVNSGGSGYEDGSEVVFTVDDGTTNESAYATVVTAREEPAVSAVVDSAGGSGAVLEPVLQQDGNVWRVSGVTVADGGTGYSTYGEYIWFSTPDSEDWAAYGYAAVDENGAITEVSMYAQGSYFRSTGVIESVSVANGGFYFKDSGVIESVVLYSGGEYWRESQTGEVISDTPVVTIFGTYDTGRDAAAVATVDTQIGSPTFGKVTSLELTNAGRDYPGSEDHGWRATINAGLIHRDEFLGESQDSPYGLGHICPGFDAAWRESPSTRIAPDADPRSLLDRTYKMAYQTLASPAGIISNADDAEYCIYEGSPGWLNGLTIVDCGLGDITIRISPA